jgi:hypothetical protein
MEKMTIDIKVHKALKEFILTTNGSDLIIPAPKSLLWQLVKQHLKVVPQNYTHLTDRSQYIRIQLLTTRAAKIHTRKIKGSQKNTFRNVTLDTTYRSYLDQTGQNAVAKHFKKAFKECFHNFVMGSIFDNPELPQKKAIENFCAAYHIQFNEMNYEMLVKSWLRSPQRAKIKGSKNICPLIF